MKYFFLSVVCLFLFSCTVQHHLQFVNAKKIVTTELIAPRQPTFIKAVNALRRTTIPPVVKCHVPAIQVFSTPIISVDAIKTKHDVRNGNSSRGFIGKQKHTVAHYFFWLLMYLLLGYIGFTLAATCSVLIVSIYLLLIAYPIIRKLVQTIVYFVRWLNSKTRYNS